MVESAASTTSTSTPTLQGQGWGACMATQTYTPPDVRSYTSLHNIPEDMQQQLACSTSRTVNSVFG